MGMLFSSFANCSSLREVSGAMLGLKGMNAGHIALIYKKRWQIELLFKQLKQNFPLKFFLGDN
ncbi:MAG: transposase [Crocinitomicaceae bacterium]